MPSLVWPEISRATRAVPRTVELFPVEGVSLIEKLPSIFHVVAGPVPMPVISQTVKKLAQQ
eukprot:47045-Heterocapsa_arctica.AAC.1